MNFHFTYLGFRADALHPRLYAAARIRGLRTRQNVGNDKVSNLPHTPAVGRLETCPTLFRRRNQRNEIATHPLRSHTAGYLAEFKSDRVGGFVAPGGASPQRRDYPR